MSTCVKLSEKKSNQLKDPYNILKLIITGNSGSGKTCILARYVEGLFQEAHLTTIGMDFRIKNLFLEDRAVKLQIWDTAGQDRFRTITNSFYGGANLIIIVFNPSKQESIDSLPIFEHEARRYGNQNMKVAIMANVFEGPRLISKETAIEYAQSVKASYFEVSARTGQNINFAFEIIARNLLGIIFDDSQEIFSMPTT